MNTSTLPDPAELAVSVSKGERAALATALNLLDDPVTLGVILGLVLGKQVGVTLFTWLVVKSGFGSRPEGVTWPMIYGVSCLAGVGFTMSLFISELAFKGILVDEAKIGIIAGSLIAGVWGYLVLRRAIAKAPTAV